MPIVNHVESRLSPGVHSQAERLFAEREFFTGFDGACRKTLALACHCLRIQRSPSCLRRVGGGSGSGRTLEVWEKPVRAFTGGVAGQSARDRKALALHTSNASHTPCYSPSVRSAACTWQLVIDQRPHSPVKNAHAFCS